MPAARLCHFVFLSLLILWPSPSWPAGLSGGVRAVTRPSADITLSFVQPGRIAFVPLQEGDAVQTDQVLVRQDDAAEQVLLAQLKAQAEDTIKTRAAEASLARHTGTILNLRMVQSSLTTITDGSP